MRKFVLIMGILVVSFSNVTYVFAEPSIKDRKKQLVLEKKEFESIFNGPSDSLITLDDYIWVGLKNNPALRSSFYAWKSSFEKISKEFALPDPQFTYTNYIEEVETRVGPQQQAFSIKQKFPFWDKLWVRKNRAFQASEEKYYQFEAQRLSLVKKITEVYYEYAYLGKSITLTEENLKLLQSFESVAQKKYATGMTQNQDLLKVQVELGKLENDLISLKDLKGALEQRIRSLLNYSQGVELIWPNETFEENVLNDEYLDLEKLYQILKKENPELISKLKAINKEKKNLQLAKRQYIPDVTLGLTQIDTGEALNSSVVDSGKDPLMVMVSFNVPLWFNRINADIRSSESALKVSEENYDEKMNSLTSELALKHYQWQDALRQSNLYKGSLIPKAVQTLNATKSAYESGKNDFLSLIDAQRMLLNFQLAYYRHSANYYQYSAQLKTLLGEFGEINRDIGEDDHE